ncbi:YcaO-like family protein [Celeribacter persicus]|uniref:Ribosomal protein S12 methylthiotransferase accessory factor n=1 Tax=Celeribacter persicus TaxID=1651082 RepID=A0A2T5HCK8_9RHOB|nr:YcaO-like family protein [Celeribacter persicus]PTQ69315.1 ribosomal protein S12 methylthiotransferase accessory factor [Celeribacter persicus]
MQDVLKNTASIDSFAWRRDASKVCLPGTDRACSVAKTLDMARAAASKVGITRVADITRLDSVGIPTFQAVRPNSLIVVVSQGKGVTPDLARVSAMMESIEHWHAEQPMAGGILAPIRQMKPRLGYDVYDLPRAEPSVLHDGLPIYWVPAVSLVDGSATWLPHELVCFSLGGGVEWTPPAFFASTNGLASGNSVLEAVLHGLYEVIERDAITRMLKSGGQNRQKVDLLSISSSVVAGLLEKFRNAQVTLEVCSLESPTGLPCFMAQVYSRDYPAEFTGFGCHSSTEIALTRAITEAAQARLGYVSGARDDLDRSLSTSHQQQVSAAQDDAVALVPKSARMSLSEDLDEVVGRVVQAFDAPPLFSDLTHPHIDVPVVRVVVPNALVTPEVF